tara:strand:+ start:27 stop:356 length:330 start_codon:yes stop_codon:yes gene_type:complete
MNHPPTKQEIAYAEEIYIAALKEEDLSTYSIDELKDAPFLTQQHSNYIKPTDDIGGFRKVKRAVESEVSKRAQAIDTVSKFKWTVFGTVIGIVITPLFNWFVQYLNLTS